MSDDLFEGDADKREIARIVLAAVFMHGGLSGGNPIDFVPMDKAFDLADVFLGIAERRFSQRTPL